jgi:hypothetical protein
MRLLFHIEPLVMHGRPFHYWAWLDRAAQMVRSLEAEAAGWDVRLALNHALGTRALAPRDPALGRHPQQGYGLARERLAVFAQEEIRALYGAPNVAILEGLHRGAWPDTTVAAHARLLRERLGGFEPDVIVSWTPSAHLRRAFPQAVVLHTEMGLFSRPPYPSHAFLDPEGMLDRSLLGTHADEIRARAAEPGDAALLADLRAGLAERHAATTPFAGFERRLRERYRSLALLPLQFGGEFAFDASGPFRNQGELLLHVAERLPEDVGLIVAQHGTALWLGDAIDDETRGYLAQACPQMLFVQPSAVPNAGQLLVPHVDTVISVSSSVGMQALYWKKRLVTPGHGYLRAWADGDDVADLAAGRESAPREQDAALAWLLRRYWVRDARLLRDGAWLDAALRRMHANWSAGVRGLAWHEEAEPVAELARGLVAEIEPAPPRVNVPADLIVNGELAPGDGIAPEGWELIAGEGAQVAVETVAGPDRGPALRLARGVPGNGPTLLVQRIADVSRLAGAFAGVRLRARGSIGESLVGYFYQQFGDAGSAARGTDPVAWGLDETWREFSLAAQVPAVEDMALGEGHHTELALLLPPGLPDGWVEIADVRVEPGELVF